MNLMYSTESSREKGTLYHLRNNMGHRNVTTNTNNCFDHTYELMDDVTATYVLCAAHHITGDGMWVENPMHTNEDVSVLASEFHIHCLTDINKILHSIQLIITIFFAVFFPTALLNNSHNLQVRSCHWFLRSQIHRR